MRKKILKQYTKNRILKVKKKPFAKTTWHDLLVNYILERIENMMSSVQGKIMSLFKTNTTKDYSKLAPANYVYDGKKTPRKLKINKTI